MLGDALLAALRLAVEALEECQVQYALIGGLGAMLRGRIRNTRDCDVLALLPEERVAVLKEALRCRGFSHLDRGDRHQLDEVILFRFWYPVGESGFSLSLDLQAGGTRFHQTILSRAKPVEFLGLRVRVATREDLILLKLTAWRPVDRADAIDLAQVIGSGLDFDYLDEWSSRLQVGDRWQEVRSQA